MRRPGRRGRVGGLVVLLAALLLAVPAGAAEDATKSNPTVELSTSLGEITIELAADEAPLSVENFLSYARKGFYDGTIFHRVIGGFVVQAGGLDTDLQAKPGLAGPIANEASNGLSNTRGTVAMARRSDPASATSQFFINLADNPFLDPDDGVPDRAGYAVFGRVTGGMEVVDKIAEVPTETRGTVQNVPIEPVIIQGVRLRD